MQEQDLARQQATEAPVVIMTTGLSTEAKQMFYQIARRAYEIFESDGRVRGHDLAHWLKAESELFEPRPFNVRESRENLTVLAEVHGFSPRELEVDLEPRRVTIIGKHQGHSERKMDGRSSSEMHTDRLLRSLQLPVEIDTRHATARLRRGVLELDVKKALRANAKTAQGASTGSHA